MVKIDEHGNYLPFPGLTIVSSIQDVDSPFWRLIDNVMRQHPLFTQYYSPLPYDSYHVTTTNLFNQKTIGEGYWKEFVLKNQLFFQSLNRELALHAFHPLISFESIYLGCVLQLMVRLPQEQTTIIDKIALKYRVQHKVPSVFHITLAYQYRYLQQTKLDELSLELNQKISTIFNSREVALNLDPPQLCYFKDMTKFTPWDGIDYPFQEQEYVSKFTP